MQTKLNLMKLKPGLGEFYRKQIGPDLQLPELTWDTQQTVRVYKAQQHYHIRTRKEGR